MICQNFYEKTACSLFPWGKSRPSGGGMANWPQENPVVGAGPWGCPLWWLGKQAAKKLPQNRGASCTSMSGSWMPADMRRSLRTHANGYQGGKAAPGTLTSEATKTPPPAVPAGQMRAKQGREAVVLTFLFWKAAHRPRHRESRRLWQKKIRAKRLLWPCRFFA